MDAVALASSLSSAQVALTRQTAEIGMVAQQAQAQQQMVQMLTDSTQQMQAAPGPGKATQVDLTV